MKVHFGSLVKLLDGETIPFDTDDKGQGGGDQNPEKKGKGSKRATLGELCGRALVNINPEFMASDWDLEGEAPKPAHSKIMIAKQRLFDLAKMCHRSKAVEMSADDVAYLQKVIWAAYGTETAGVIVDQLESGSG